VILDSSEIIARIGRTLLPKRNDFRRTELEFAEFWSYSTVTDLARFLG
jgi:hypothetical protein